MVSSSQELSLQPAVWPGLHRLPKWHISQMVLLNLIVSGITSSSNLYVFMYVHWKKLESFKIKTEAICVISPQHCRWILHKRAWRRNKPCNMLARSSSEPEQQACCVSVSFHGAQAIEAQTLLFPNCNGMHNKEVVKSFVRLWWKLLVPRGCVSSLSQTMMGRKQCLFSWLKRP